MRVPDNARRVGYNQIILDVKPEEVQISVLKKENKDLKTRLSKIEFMMGII